MFCNRGGFTITELILSLTPAIEVGDDAEFSIEPFSTASLDALGNKPLKRLATLATPEAPASRLVLFKTETKTSRCPRRIAGCFDQGREGIDRVTRANRVIGAGLVQRGRTIPDAPILL